MAGSLLLGMSATLPLLGQDALRTAVLGDRAYRARTATRVAPPEQLKAGPVLLTASLSYALEWNDNIFYAPENAEQDLIHRPQCNVSAFWPATRDSLLSFGMGLGYEAYTTHSELNQLLITPDSELAWDIPVKDFVFTVYDRFQYSQDVVSQGALSRTARFPRLENTAGLRARWHPDPYRLEAGYSHYNFFSQSGTYDYLARSAEQFFGRAAYHFAAATFGGLEVSADLTDYDSAQRSDNTGVSLGPFVEWQITRALELSLRGGYVLYSPDPDPLTGQSADLKSYYLGLDAQHRLTEAITHGISAQRSVQQGLNEGSQFLELFTARYFATWAFYRYATLSADLFYEHGTEPRRVGLFLLEETFDRFGLGVGLGYQLLPRLRTGVNYRFVNRDSNRAEREYQLNVVTVTVAYRF